MLNYLDRNNIAAARLGTLEKDTGLVGNQYNTVIVCFTFMSPSRFAERAQSGHFLRGLYPHADSYKHDLEEDTAFSFSRE